MKMKLRARLGGVRQMLKAVDELTGKEFRKAARQGVTTGAQEAAKAIKANAPVGQTKMLKKSIGYRVKAKTKGGSGYFAVVGARRDTRATVRAGKAKFRKAVGVRKRAGGLASVVKYANPAKYAHLVEFGRKEVQAGSSKGKTTGKRLLSDGTRVYGKKAKAAPPKPFMMTAWQQSMGRCKALIGAKLAEAIRRAGRNRGPKGKN